MKVESILVAKDTDEAVDVTVEIENHTPLRMNFKGKSDLPSINDCVFLSLYLQALQDGTTLCMPERYRVSRALVDNLEELKKIFCEWFSDELNDTEVEVKTHEETPETNGTAVLYSGGVDSNYTFVERREEISHLFLCLGLDIQHDEKTKVENAIKYYSKFAERNKKKLLIFSTNFREVFPNFNNVIQHAAILTAPILALGLRKLYVPASHSLNELFPWGSHVLTDRLLSNGITQVEHHGAISRARKTESIARDQFALDILRVCNTSEEFNCGRCEKCLRTMFVLEILNKSSENLPQLSREMKFLDDLKIHSPSQHTFWQDNLNFASAKGRSDLESKARAIVRSYLWRRWLKDGIQLIKGDRVKY